MSATLVVHRCLQRWEDRLDPCWWLGGVGVEECRAIIAEAATHRRSETMGLATESRVEAILMSRQRMRSARFALMMREI